MLYISYYMPKFNIYNQNLMFIVVLWCKDNIKNNKKLKVSFYKFRD